jgi:hypothetical protein
MDDLEAREVRDLPLEAGVLGATDERCVESVASERLPHARIAAR